MRKEVLFVLLVLVFSIGFASAQCEGDYNNDGVVDYDDYFVNGSVQNVVDANLGNVCEAAEPEAPSAIEISICPISRHF
jgi:hypothetical protein